MSIVTPCTNFIDLLSEIIDYLEEQDPMNLDLLRKCYKALEELEEL